MKPRITTVITDLDNTLYDWVDMWCHSFGAMLERLVADSGIPREQLEAEFKTVHQRHGTSEYAFSIQELPSLVAKHRGDDPSKIYHGAIQAYRDVRRATLMLYPSVRPTLETLKRIGCSLIAYTESMEYYTRYRMLRLGLFRRDLLEYYQLPSHYQNALELITVTHLKLNIERQLNEIGLAPPIPLVVGTLPTGSLNAKCIKVPESNSFIVVLSSGTLGMLLSFSYCACLLLLPFIDRSLAPKKRAAVLEQRIQSRSGLIDSIVSILLSSLFLDLPAQLTISKVLPEFGYRHITAVKLLAAFSIMFIIAHEYAHLVLNHKPKTVNQPNVAGKGAATELVWGWDDEFSADLFAAELVFGVIAERQSKSHPIDMIHSHEYALFASPAPDFCFSCRGFFEDARQLVGRTDLQSHPPVHLRRTRLRSYIMDCCQRRQLPREDCSPLVMGAELQNALDKFWQAVRPSFQHAVGRNRSEFDASGLLCTR